MIVFVFKIWYESVCNEFLITFLSEILIQENSENKMKKDKKNKNTTWKQ